MNGFDAVENATMPTRFRPPGHGSKLARTSCDPFGVLMKSARPSRSDSAGRSASVHAASWMNAHSSITTKIQSLAAQRLRIIRRADLHRAAAWQ